MCQAHPPAQIDARQDVEKPVQLDDTDEDERDDLVAPLSRRNTNAMIADNDRDEIMRIASQISRRRSSVASLQQVPSHGGNGLDDEDPKLDPQSDSFDLGKWVRHFVSQVRKEDRAGPNTGVSWRDLNVYGSGDAIQIQKTVGSLLMAPLRLGDFFSFGKKEHKQILHGFNGILKPGELLVVLGRPGSRLQHHAQVPSAASSTGSSSATTPRSTTMASRRSRCGPSSRARRRTTRKSTSTFPI